MFQFVPLRATRLVVLQAVNAVTGNVLAVVLVKSLLIVLHAKVFDFNPHVWLSVQITGIGLVLFYDFIIEPCLTSYNKINKSSFLSVDSFLTGAVFLTTSVEICQPQKTTFWTLKILGDRLMIRVNWNALLGILKSESLEMERMESTTLSHVKSAAVSVRSLFEWGAVK